MRSPDTVVGRVGWKADSPGRRKSFGRGRRQWHETVDSRRMPRVSDELLPAGSVPSRKRRHATLVEERDHAFLLHGRTERGIGGIVRVEKLVPDGRGAGLIHDLEDLLRIVLQAVNLQPHRDILPGNRSRVTRLHQVGAAVHRSLLTVDARLCQIGTSGAPSQSDESAPEPACLRPAVRCVGGVSGPNARVHQRHIRFSGLCVGGIHSDIWLVGRHTGEQEVALPISTQRDQSDVSERVV